MGSGKPNDEDAVDKVYEELVARSNEFYDDGRYEQALETYEDASRVDSKQGLAWYMKGMSLFKMEKYDEALLAFDMAAKLDSGLTDPLLGKAYVYIKLFRFEDAIRQLKSMFAMEITAETACLVGLCYVLLDREDDAAEWFRRAVEKHREFTLGFFDEMYTGLILRDSNITSDEKVAVKAAIDKLKKKISSPKD